MGDIVGRIGCLGIGYAIARASIFRPSIRKRGGILEARAGWFATAITFGAFQRRILIDPAQGVVRILDRQWWFVRRYRRIPFDQIREIVYAYCDVSPFPFWDYQETDLFVVALRLQTGETVRLLRFVGMGDFVNNSPFPDWWYWEDELEARITRGTQEDDSRLLAETLARLTGVPLANA